MSQKRFPLHHLLFNHVDAWQVALIIGTLAVLIHGAISGQTLLLLTAVAVGYWFGFALNDYYDAPFDALDAQKAQGNFFVLVQPPRWQIWSVVTAVSLFLIIVFSQFGGLGLALLALCFVVMWAYSAPPLRIKERPGLDLLMHATFVQTYPYVLVMLLIGATWTRLDGALLCILSLASLTAQVEQQARDFDTDKLNGRNATILLGYSNAIRLLRAFTVLMLVVALVFVLNGTMPGYLLPFGIIGLPAMLHRFWRDKTAVRSEKLVVLSTTTGLIYTGLIFTYFLLK